MSEASSESSGNLGLEIKIPAALLQFKVLPKDDEERNDENIPKNLAEAMMVFYRTNANNGENATRMQACLDAVLDMYKTGPSGNNRVDIGQAIVCWACGFVGLPENLDAIGGSIAEIRENMPPFAACRNCHMSDETNFIRVEHPQDKTQAMPFVALKAV